MLMLDYISLVEITGIQVLRNLKMYFIVYRFCAFS